MKMTIGHLYPDLLNLYGDRGNIACLKQRCKWRGIEAETVEIKYGDEVDFSKFDIVLLGGGSDKEQKMVCDELRKVQPAFKEYVENNGVLLALCGGYELLGKYYTTGEGKVEALGIVDMYTELGADRMLDNVVLKSDLVDMYVVGFENHSGRVCINDNKPLGKVICGHGNDGQSGYEGVVYKNVIGTYLYGPLLPKNPEVTDWLIKRALEKKYDSVELAPLDDSAEKAANQYIYQRFVENK